MSNELTLHAELRSNTGKGASRRLRKENKVPGIVYGGKKAPQMVTLAFKDLTKALESESFYSQIVTLSIDGKTQQTVLRDLQRHPSRGEPTHADFLRVDAKQKITMVVPLHFLNEDKCIGVKQQGGEVQRNAAEVEVICLPKDIPEFVAVDMTNVQMGEIVHLSDLTLPEGVQILALTHGAEHDQPVAAVHKPKGQITEDEAAETAEAGEGTADADTKDAAKKDGSDKGDGDKAEKKDK
jgi:large subunit ribosomal protein L25